MSTSTVPRLAGALSCLNIIYITYNDRTSIDKEKNSDHTSQQEHKIHESSTYGYPDTHNVVQVSHTHTNVHLDKLGLNGEILGVFIYNIKIITPNVLNVQVFN